MERVIHVKDKEFYRPVHERTLEEYDKINKPYRYNPMEQAEAKKWDFFRFSDNTYRFNVQLIQMARILDEREDTEYLTRVWKISGKSEIGNELEFIKNFNIDTFMLPKYNTKVVQTSGQSLKTEAGDVFKTETRFVNPFNCDNVLEAMKDSIPQYNLKYISLYAETFNGKKSVSLEKKFFLAWLLAPIEFIMEYNRTGNKALVSLDINNLPTKYQDKLTEFQLEKIKKVIDDSNIIMLDEQEEIQKEETQRAMAAQGISNEAPKTVEKVKLQKDTEEKVKIRDVH